MKSIMFTDEMVRKIRAGQKTQTRRLVKPSPAKWLDLSVVPSGSPGECRPTTKEDIIEIVKPPYQVGDTIYIKEGCYLSCRSVELGKNGQAKWPKTKPDHFEIFYTADESGIENNKTVHKMNKMFMPQWASLTTLEVNSVRPERLRQITEQDAKSEGADGGCVNCGVDNCSCDDPCPDYTDGFYRIWNGIHGDGADYYNPWVWAYTFEVQQQSTNHCRN